MSDDRTPIAPKGAPGNPHAHLDPVVQAELSWGNALARDWYDPNPKVGDPLRCELRRPLHVERLRAAFAFPPTVRLSTSAPRGKGQRPLLHLYDARGWVQITSPLPDGWPVEDREIAL
jgi:hypothetical protein